MGAKKEFDQSPEARTPGEGVDTPVSAVTIMRVVDVRLRFPEANIKEVASMCGIERHLVPRALSTPMALARMDSAYDIRGFISENLRNQALTSFVLLQKVQLESLKQLEEEGTVPDAALLSAAVRTSLETLKGVGLLKDHSIEETRPVDAAGVSNLLDQADALRKQIEEKLQKKVDVEVVASQEVEDIALD